MKRLAKVERGIQEKLKRQAKRYNKSYPGELVHLDTKRLPLLKGQKATDNRDYLFVAIDDFSRELYAAILPDKTADSAAKFLTEHLIDPCPYLIECVYSDNGTEYKGSANHAFGVACYENGIGQKFTRVVIITHKINKAQLENITAALKGVAEFELEIPSSLRY